MAATPAAVQPSLASEYVPAGTWLTQDTTNPTGKGPVTTGPVEPLEVARSGTAPVPLNPPVLDWNEAEFAAQSPDFIIEPVNPHAGPWPAVPEESQGKEPFGTLIPDGIEPKGYYRVPPEITGLYQTKALLPGHDRHSQDVDNAGWEQYTLTGRVAARQGWWQNYLGVEDFWPITQPNLAKAKVAMGANQMVHGVVAQYGDLSNSGGDIAYEPAPPPPVSTQPPIPAGPGTIPQWGF
jgi:hypothetical protein